MGSEGQHWRTLLYGATPQSDYVYIEVRAVDEEDRLFVWRATLLRCQALQDVAVAWGAAHGIATEDVALETEEERSLLLSQTPWVGERVVHTKCLSTLSLHKGTQEMGRTRRQLVQNDPVVVPKQT